VITRVIALSPLRVRRSTRSCSPCDHAFAVHHGEPRDQAVGVVVSTDPEEVVQTAVPHVSTGERLKPDSPLDGPDEVAIEMSPERLSPPALRFPEPKMDVRGDADQTEDSRVEAELLLEHARPVHEQRLLDGDSRKTPATGELQGR